MKKKFYQVLYLLIIVICSLLMQSSLCSNMKGFGHTVNSIVNNWSLTNVVISKEKHGSFNYVRYEDIVDKHYYEIKSQKDLEKYINYEDEENSIFIKYDDSYFNNNTLIVFPVIENDDYGYLLGEKIDNIYSGCRIYDHLYVERKIDNTIHYKQDKKVYFTILFEINGSIQNHMEFNVVIMNKYIN